MPSASAHPCAVRLCAMPSLQMLLPLVSEEGAGLWPYVVGGGALLLMLAAMLALLSFGKGREHS